MTGMLILEIHTFDAGAEDAVARQIARVDNVVSVTRMDVSPPERITCDGLPLDRTTCPDRAAHM